MKRKKKTVSYIFCVQLVEESRMKLERQAKHEQRALCYLPEVFTGHQPQSHNVTERRWAEMSTCSAKAGRGPCETQLSLATRLQCTA